MTVTANDNNLANPIELYLNQLAPSSRRTMLSYLWVFARYLGYKAPEKAIIKHEDGTVEYKYPPIEWPKLSMTDVSSYLEYLRTTKKANNHQTRHQVGKKKTDTQREKTTLKLHLAAIKSSMKMASRYSGIAPEYKVSKELLEDILSIQIRLAKSQKKDTTIDDGSLARLFDVNPQESPAGARNQAIFHAMRYCGLRVDEVTRLMFPASLDFANRELIVDGKGAKQRRVPMNEKTENAICDWIDLHRGELEGPLFTQLRKGGQLIVDDFTGEIAGLTPSGIDYIITQSCRKAGIESINTHDFRRTFATRLLANGADAFTVRDLMGHENVETTLTYDMRDDKRKFEAIDSQ